LVLPIILNQKISQLSPEITYRPIAIHDNLAVAQLIRTVLKEHGVDKPGTVYTDPTTDDLFSLFQHEKSAYFIAELHQQVIGVCGVYPTKGLPDNCLELVKLYVSSKARNKGVATELMNLSFQKAKELGYASIYLETMPELTNAIHLYERVGFQLLDNSLGNSGHYACTIWMLKNL
jgi:putative acetyltransferase